MEDMRDVFFVIKVCGERAGIVSTACLSSVFRNGGFLIEVVQCCGAPTALWTGVQSGSVIHGTAVL